MEQTWKSKVYMSKEVDYRLRVLPRGKMLQRDRYTCQSCRKRLPAHDLSIHHIIPRAEGGTNIPDNLITLCHSCHDLIELADPPIRTKQEILYHKQALDLLIEEENEPYDEESTTETGDERPAWHKWVYGGQKRK